jgi:hypothetical protein
MDRTLRVEEDELKLAVAQFVRARGFHATPEGVRFVEADGPTVAEVAIKVRGPSGDESAEPAGSIR